MVANKYEQIARQFLGIPYRHGGRDREGLDCVGLVHLFYRELGIKVPDTDGRPYSTDWYKKDPERLLRGLLQVGRPVDLKTEPLQPLDLVYFRMGGAITHAGVMIDQHSFLHVLTRKTVQISSLNPAWKRRLQGARRLI
ncbi:MAG TPA: C40 family peptidase [Firmicutes bacterium]|uniref:C40 family peptidase n=1 Tax=Capillibacterium thermochitinicola TaxID=2699427 RepID=A0A8J6I023_9FIRM|nr:C40 family peptidase [Capillibacterium thermochitinicola]MBA2132778.1 C40 family peptidase [Capillibacterium thermochitinicola]HHW12981.1 C40 family peptidase [Bacillota bacterium]